MPLRVTCPHCQTTGELPDEAAGKRVTCRACTKAFTTPDPALAAPPEDLATAARRAFGYFRRGVVVTSVGLRVAAWSLCWMWTMACFRDLSAGMSRQTSAIQEGAFAAYICANLIAGYVGTRCFDAIVSLADRPK